MLFATVEQGCHKGRFWRKITVRTSARVRVYPADAVKTTSVQTHLPPLPSPSLPSPPLSLPPLCCPCGRKQGCHGDGRTDMSICPSVTSDKVLVRQIRVNAMLTSDKVKPELLCPRWLPRCCHVGWLDVSFHYVARAAEHIVLWRARMAAIGARTATEWGARG
jgi:hypothetical protein